MATGLSVAGIALSFKSVIELNQRFILWRTNKARGGRTWSDVSQVVKNLHLVE